MSKLLLIAWAAVQWTITPDGCEYRGGQYCEPTFAIVKNYGGKPDWSREPDTSGGGSSELRICSGVPSEETARQIADFLNKQAGR